MFTTTKPDRDWKTGNKRLALQKYFLNKIEKLREIFNKFFSHTLTMLAIHMAQTSGGNEQNPQIFSEKDSPKLFDINTWK